MQVRKLPNDQQAANEMLASEVNRLSGQVSALIAFIKALNVLPDTTPDSLVTAAAELQLPPIVPAIGPSVVVPHASITITELLSKE